MTPSVLIFFAALFLLNLVAFGLYGIDKRRARQGKWRISEARLLLIAALGGSLGAWIGMRVFRHKTKHWKFRLAVPLLLLIHCLLLLGYLSLRMGWLVALYPVS